MSYSTCIAANIGTAGLTLLAAITNADGTPHATVRDLAVTAIAQGQYQLITSSIPYGYLGTVVFYTTALSAAVNWNGVAIQAITDSSELTPIQQLRSVQRNTASVSGDVITFDDGTTQTVTAAGRVTA